MLLRGRVAAQAGERRHAAAHNRAQSPHRRVVAVCLLAQHGIDPQTIRKAVTDLVAQFRAASGFRQDGAPVPFAVSSERARRTGRRAAQRAAGEFVENSAELPAVELERLISTLEIEMRQAATELRFEYAARLRDEIRRLNRELAEVG